MSATEIVLYAFGAAMAAWIVMSVSGSLPVFFLWRERLQPVGDSEARQCLARVLSRGIVDPQWAAACNFEPAGAYAVTNVAGLFKIVAWTKARESTYLYVYLIGNARIDMEFVTDCGEKSLSSGTTKDRHLFPTRIGSWKQSFSTPNASELWSRHQDALKYLAEVAGFQPDPCTRNLQEEFDRELRREAEHIRSLSLWPLRAPYWYFVRRSARHGKSIRQLMAP